MNEGFLRLLLAPHISSSTAPNRMEKFPRSMGKAAVLFSPSPTTMKEETNERKRALMGFLVSFIDQEAFVYFEPAF